MTLLSTAGDAKRFTRLNAISAAGATVCLARQLRLLRVTLNAISAAGATVCLARQLRLLRVTLDANLNNFNGYVGDG